MSRLADEKKIRKPGKGAPLNGKQLPWGGFINVNLNQADKAAFIDWKELQGDSIRATIEDLVSIGFKLSLSYDAPGDFFLACFTGEGLALVGDEARYCLTARAPGMGDAIALLLYKHWVMLDRDWSAAQKPFAKDDRFG